MAVQTITYGDKQYLNQNADIPATNKVQDTDMNEIKSVVNNNANETSNNTTNIDNIVNSLNGTVLYESSIGSSSTFTINDNISNYSKILITYSRSSGAQYYSVLLDMEQIGSVSVPLTIVDAGGSNFIIYGCRISFSGTTATISNNGAREVLSSSANINNSGYEISINKIIGYKKINIEGE